MKVFLSWSGQASRDVAQAVRDWLQAVVPGVEPCVPPQDIAAGRRWGREPGDGLERSDLGIVCVLPDGLGDPWLLFELGALATALDDKRLVALLVGVEPPDLPDPLARMQAARVDKDDLLRLARSINGLLQPPRADELVRSSFEISWLGLETRIGAAMRKVVRPPAGGDVPVLNDGELRVLRVILARGWVTPAYLATELRQELAEVQSSVDALHARALVEIHGTGGAVPSIGLTQKGRVALSAA